jgi:thioredoxin reductase
VLNDVIVVGGGPAGLSAATWAARHRRSVLVVDDGQPRNRWADTSHGYFGHDPATPSSLLDAARRQIARYGRVSFIEGEATAARRDDRHRFVVRVGDEEHVGERLVLATGVRDELPQVEGFLEHYGASAFHCGSCDGYEAEGRTVAIIGWGEHVAGYALGLLDWARQVTVITEGHRFEGGPRLRSALEGQGVRVLRDNAAALVGRRGALRGLLLASGSLVPAELLFFSIAHHPRLSLARQLGCAVTEEGCLHVDRDGRTSVDGCYAAGDVTPGSQLVAVAVGEGAAAGVACAASLRGQVGAPNSPPPAPDVPSALTGLELR